jgi:hypothetical protein
MTSMGSTACAETRKRGNPGIGFTAHTEARRRGDAENGFSLWARGRLQRSLGSATFLGAAGHAAVALAGCFCVGATLACAAAPAAPPGSPPTTTGEGAAPAQQEEQLVPAGYGTLRQDEVTVQLRSGPLLIKATPLAEAVIRLLAPDTYDRLHALAESRRTEAAQGTIDAPEMFLVSFFSYEPDVTFTPEDLQLTHQGRLMRATRVLPVTSGFGRQRLAQQENQTAIYVFDERIDYQQPIVVRYELVESGDWTQIIPKLEVERARVRARVR